MPTGTVNWFDDKKRFGFITPDDGGEDLFVHHSGIAGRGSRTLPDGAKVEYEVAQGLKGPQARNVRVIAHATDQRKTRAASSSPARSPRDPRIEGQPLVLDESRVAHKSSAPWHGRLVALPPKSDSASGRGGCA